SNCSRAVPASLSKRVEVGQIEPKPTSISKPSRSACSRTFFRCAGSVEPRKRGSEKWPILAPCLAAKSSSSKALQPWLRRLKKSSPSLFIGVCPVAQEANAAAPAVAPRKALRLSELNISVSIPRGQYNHLVRHAILLTLLAALPAALL